MRKGIAIKLRKVLGGRSLEAQQKRQWYFLSSPQMVCSHVAI